MDAQEFKARFLQAIQNRENAFHPLVWINGDPEIGEGTFIGFFSEINAKDARVAIGRRCDIASFVAINAADSHRMCLGLSDHNTRRDIEIGDHVFIGSHSVVLGGAVIGHHCVVAAGSVVRAGVIPPFSLVAGNPATIKPGYYQAEYEAMHGPWTG